MLTPTAFLLLTAVAANASPVASTEVRGAFESLVQSFPSGTPGGAQDLFASATALLGIARAESFGLELGAELRLRLVDGPPTQRDADFARLLRREDWDQLSDFGQLLRELRLGREGGAVTVRAGPQPSYTLGHGHLVGRYSNRDDPDYHPCGASVQLALGPTSTELFASDVLAARLFAAQTSIDLARLAGAGSGHFDRYHAAFSLAHDQGASGHGAPPMSLLHLDLDAALFRGAITRVFVHGGLGSRVMVATPDLGAEVGLSAEATPSGLQLGGRLELRKQGRGFRQAIFGPGYELSRYSALGLDGAPLAADALPDGYSGHLEFSVSSGPADGDKSRVVLSVAGEYFSWGRLDLDAGLGLRALGGKALVSARMVASGLGQRARYLVSGEARYRLAPSLYGTASAGTLYFPQPDRTLVRGLHAGLGVGLDFDLQG